MHYSDMCVILITVHGVYMSRNKYLHKAQTYLDISNFSSIPTLVSYAVYNKQVFLTEKWRFTFKILHVCRNKTGYPVTVIGMSCLVTDGFDFASCVNNSSTRTLYMTVLLSY